MGSAIKPTKREIVRALAARRRTQLQAEYREAQAELTELHRDSNARFHAQESNLLADILQPIAVTRTLVKLRDMGLHPTVVKNVTRDGDGPDTEEVLQYTITVPGNLKITTKLPPKLVALRAERARVVAEMATLRQRVNRMCQELSRPEGEILEQLLQLLPDEAVPHLEALQRLAGEVLARGC